MTIEEKDIDRVSDHLTKKFRAGNKWVAYTHPFDLPMATCFRDIKSVHRLCASIHGKFGYFMFKPIIEVLKVVSGANEVAAKNIDHGMVADQVGRYPISAYKFEQPLSRQLAEGGYSPVNWLTQVTPSTAIDKYHIVTHISHGLFIQHDHQATITQTCNNYREAENAFQLTLNKSLSLDTTSRHEVLLVGQMRGQALKIGPDGHPQENTGVVFKKANSLKEYSILQVNDPAKPVELYQPMMAKFNTLHANLEFFNGQLEKVSPGAKIEYMNFSLLSNDRVWIQNSVDLTSQLKSTSQEEDVKQQKKLRPGLGI